MKIFKAISFSLIFAFLLIGCKPQQPIAGNTKKGNESLIAENEALRDSLSRLAQRKTDSVFSMVLIERAKKTVYRGVRNPLTIVVPNAVSVKAEGTGLMKVDNSGRYDLRPGLGTKAEIKIKAVMPDGKIFTESRLFNIRNLPRPKSFFAGIQAGSNAEISLTEEQIKKGAVSLMMVDFDYDLEFNILGFDVLFPNGKSVTVEGAAFNAKALELLKKLKHNNKIQVYNIRSKSSPEENIALFHFDPITIRVNKKNASKK